MKRSKSPDSSPLNQNKLRVFISSKMGELRDVREVVELALHDSGIAAFVYEKQGGARPGSVEATSLDEVESADIYVGLFAEGYGEVTIREFRHARALGKPCFVYIRDKDKRREEALENFLKTEIYDISKGVTYSYFDSAIDLGKQIADDIMSWLVRRHREMTAEIAEHRVSADYVESLQKEVERLQAFSSFQLPQGAPVDLLSQRLRDWFKTLGYTFENYEERTNTSVEWIINIPVRRQRYERVLVRSIEGEAKLKDVRDLRSAVKKNKTSEGWLVAVRRVSQAAKKEAEKDGESVACFTFDELIDQDADFSEYLNWLEEEIKSRKIESMYVPLECVKDEYDPDRKVKIGESVYDESNGWIDGYIDRWLADPSKEHVSILGEFGTGKTWFAFHYAWVALQRYEEAKERGVERPRLPLIIPLRDFSKAVSVESLFSEFFFRKHEIPLAGYSVFEQLNRMGKLLLIFDGFDEMAARVDRQKMINNFWELARVVVPGSKVMLTCRSEHFPEAKEGRALLGAELQASTSNLTGEPPQFEVLQLRHFTPDQIKKALSLRAEPSIVKKIMANKELLDLARRPIMTDFILEALPEISAGKTIDMSRVYLYAVRRKIERDIKSERTFTSLADKLYFLCELSWEMISTEQMSINYRDFPDRLRRLFGPAVQDQKDLDHWHYDMMGQTMLIRNEDGDYRPAHRSLLEFFVAYKFTAELGVLAPDFTDMARAASHVNPELSPADYTWRSYFESRSNTTDQSKRKPPLARFRPESIEHLANTVGEKPLPKATLDLMLNMVSHSERTSLLEVVQATREKATSEVGVTGANILSILTGLDPNALVGCDLSNSNLNGLEFSRNIDLLGVNFQGANLRDADFLFCTMINANFQFSDLEGANINQAQFDGGSLHPIKQQLVVCSDNNILVWDLDSRSLVARAENLEGPWTVKHTADGEFLITGAWGGFEIRDSQTLRLLSSHENSTIKGRGSEPTNLWILDLAMNSDSTLLANCSVNGGVYLWDLEQREQKQVLQGHRTCVNSARFSHDDKYLLTSSNSELILWDVSTWKVITKRAWSKSDFVNAEFLPGSMSGFSATDGTLLMIDFLTMETKESIPLNSDGSSNILAVSPNGPVVCVGSWRGEVEFVDYTSKSSCKTLALNTYTLFEEDEGPTAAVEEICFDPSGTTAYFITKGGVVVVYNLEIDDVVDVFYRLPPMSGADFRNAIGLDESLKKQLKLNGALV